jgi:protein-disulfide isomerase
MLLLSLLGVTVAGHAQQNADSPAGTLERERLEALVNELIETRLEQLGLLDEGFDERVKQGILVFVEEQQREQQQARAQSGNELAKAARPVSATDDHIYGDPAAPITLIEYSDFECPFCKRFHATPRRLVDEHSGQVNWVYRHFPLGFHNPGAQKQAEASECANELGGNDAFWEYSDLIYARTKSNGNGFPISQLVPLAVEIGLDEGQFGECLDSGRYTEHVAADVSDGEQAGVRGTPGNILRVNQSGLSVAIQGAQPYENVKQRLDLLLDSLSEN